MYRCIYCGVECEDRRTWTDVVAKRCTVGWWHKWEPTAPISPDTEHGTNILSDPPDESSCSEMNVTQDEVDAQLLQQHSHNGVFRVSRYQPRFPNYQRVLVVGDCGVGKSSLINAVLSLTPETGSSPVGDDGTPCTQEFADYGPTPSISLRLCDTPGLDRTAVGLDRVVIENHIHRLATYVQAARDTEAFFDVAWYVVSERWRVIDTLICNGIRAMGLPIVFVITHADERAPALIETIQKEIRGFCGEKDADIEVFVTSCKSRLKQICVPSCCPEGHDELFVSAKHGIWRCMAESCSCEGVISSQFAADCYDRLVQATVKCEKGQVLLPLSPPMIEPSLTQCSERSTSSSSTVDRSTSTSDLVRLGQDQKHLLDENESLTSYVNSIRYVAASRSALNAATGSLMEAWLSLRKPLDNALPADAHLSDTTALAYLQLKAGTLRMFDDWVLSYLPESPVSREFLAGSATDLYNALQSIISSQSGVPRAASSSSLASSGSVADLLSNEVLSEQVRSVNTLRQLLVRRISESYVLPILERVYNIPVSRIVTGSVNATSTLAHPSNHRLLLPHLPVLMRHLPVLSPYMDSLLSVEMRSALLPNLGEILPLLDQLEPHMETLMQPEVQRTVIPHLDRLLPHLRTLSPHLSIILAPDVRARILPHMPLILPHLPTLSPHLETLMETSVRNDVLPHLDVLLPQMELLAPHLPVILSPKMRGSIVPHVALLAPSLPQLSPHLNVLLQPSTLEPLLPHLPTLLPHLQTLSPFLPTILSEEMRPIILAHMDVLSQTMDQLVPHLGTLLQGDTMNTIFPTHADALLRKLPVLSPHLGSLLADDIRPILLQNIETLIPIIDQLGPHLNAIFQEQTLSALRPHLPTLTRLLPALLPHLDALLSPQVLPALLDNVALIVPHLDAILPHCHELAQPLPPAPKLSPSPLPALTPPLSPSSTRPASSRLINRLMGYLPPFQPAASALAYHLTSTPECLTRLPASLSTPSSTISSSPSQASPEVGVHGLPSLGRSRSIPPVGGGHPRRPSPLMLSLGGLTFLPSSITGNTAAVPATISPDQILTGTQPPNTNPSALELLVPHLAMVCQNLDIIAPRLDLLLSDVEVRAVVFTALKDLSPLLEGGNSPQLATLLEDETTVRTLVHHFPTLQPHLPALLPHVPKLLDPAIWPGLCPHASALLSHMPILAPHLPTLIEHIDRVLPHTEILCKYLDQLEPVVGEMLSADTLDQLLPHFDTLALHLPALAPHLPALMAQKEMLLPHLSLLVPHLGTLGPYLGDLLPHHAELAPHLPALMAHMEALSPYVPALVAHRESLLPYTHYLLPHIPELLPYANSGHFGSLIPYIDRLAPRIEELSPHMNELLPHLDRLVPHLDVFVLHLDTLVPALGKTIPHIDALIDYLGWALPSSHRLLSYPVVVNTLPVFARMLPKAEEKKEAS